MCDSPSDVVHNIENAPKNTVAAVSNAWKDAYDSALPDSTRETINGIAGPVAEVVGTAINPFLGAAIATAVQTSQENDANGKWNAGDTLKNGLINFGTAAAAQWAGDALKASNEAQAGRDLASKTATTYGTTAANAPGAMQGFAAAETPAGYTGTLTVPGVTNAARNLPGSAAQALGTATGPSLSTFGMTTPDNTTTWKDPNLVKDSGSSVQNMRESLVPSTATLADKAYNGAINPKVVGPLANSALTSTLAPAQSTALSGFDSSGEAASGTIAQPSGSDVLNAFGGDALNSSDQITQEQLDQMRASLGKNAGMQAGSVHDVMLPAGQVTPDVNTPYSSQLNNIDKSYNQAGTDLTNQVNTENWNRYNTGLFDNLSAANPGRITQEQFNGWTAQPSTAPQEIMGLFQPKPMAI